MFQAFDATTANSLWRKVAVAIRGEHGPVRHSRAGDTIDLGPTTLTLTNPRERWVVSRQPPINPAFAIAEVVWILCGRNDADFLNYFNTKLPHYAGDASIYHGAYGHRLRHQLGIDQLQQAYSALASDSESRQVVLQIWDSRVDLPDEDGTPRSADIPCNVVAMLKVRDGRLEWTQVMRSNDLFRGTPYNIVQFTSLQEVVAGWLSIELGHFHLVADSLHVYTRDLASLDTIAELDSDVNVDVLATSKEVSETAFADLANCIDYIRSTGTTPGELLQLVTK